MWLVVVSETNFACHDPVASTIRIALPGGTATAKATILLSNKAFRLFYVISLVSPGAFVVSRGARCWWFTKNVLPLVSRENTTMIWHLRGVLFYHDHVSLALFKFRWLRSYFFFTFYCEKYKCTLYAESATTVETSAIRVARTERGASVLVVVVPVPAVSSSLPV
jgi:hypothetical protein